MTINQNNYEVFLLDYIEGNLDPLLTAELMAFLAENPAYDQLLGDLETVGNGTETQFFDAKNLLKKELSDLPVVNDTNFEEFCIAAGEGILSNNDNKRLHNFIGADPLKIKTLLLYRKIRLIPDLLVTYNHKNILRKPEARTRQLGRFYIYMAVAASVALLTMLWIRNPVQEGNFPSIVEQPSLSSVPVHAPVSPIIANTGIPVEKAVMPAFAAKGNVMEPTAVQNNKSQDATIRLDDLTPLPGRIAAPVRNKLPLSAFLPGKLESPALLNTFKADALNPAHTDNFLSQLADKINLWKTAETAVQGFNYLTEARVSINRIANEDGKTTALLLETDRYTVSGKKWK